MTRPAHRWPSSSPTSAPRPSDCRRSRSESSLNRSAEHGDLFPARRTSSDVDPAQRAGGLIASQARSVISAADAYSQEIREAARGDARVVLADAIEDARRIRTRIDALADAAAELLRDVRKDADRLTAELGFEPELLQGQVVEEIEPGAGADQSVDESHAEAVDGSTAPDEDTSPDENPGGDADAEAGATAATVAPEGEKPTVAPEEEKPTAVHERPRQTVAAEPVVQESATGDLSLDDEPADQPAGRSTTAAPIDLDDGSDSDKSADEPDKSAAEPQQEDKVADAVVIDDREKEKGKGKKGKSDPVPCKACDTTGECSHCKGKGKRARFFRCSECGGSGRCSVCGGPGYIWADRT